MTVVLEIPNCAAMRAFGTPSAASLLISAQSSKVITLQSLSAHFSPPKLFSFRAPPTASAVGGEQIEAVSTGEVDFWLGSRGAMVYVNKGGRIRGSVFLAHVVPL